MLWLYHLFSSTTDTVTESSPHRVPARDGNETHLVGSFLRHPAGKQRAGPRGELQSQREKQHNSGNHCSEHNSPKPPQILQSTWEADNGTAGGVVEEAGWGLVHYLLSCTHSHSLKIKGCHIHVCGPTLYEDG